MGRNRSDSGISSSSNSTVVCNRKRLPEKQLMVYVMKSPLMEKRINSLRKRKRSKSPNQSTEQKDSIDDTIDFVINHKDNFDDTIDFVIKQKDNVDETADFVIKQDSVDDTIDFVIKQDNVDTIAESIKQKDNIDDTIDFVINDYKDVVTEAEPPQPLERNLRSRKFLLSNFEIEKSPPKKIQKIQKKNRVAKSRKSVNVAIEKNYNHVSNAVSKVVSNDVTKEICTDVIEEICNNAVSNNVPVFQDYLVQYHNNNLNIKIVRAVCNTIKQDTVSNESPARRKTACETSVSDHYVSPTCNKSPVSSVVSEKVNDLPEDIYHLPCRITSFDRIFQGAKLVDVQEICLINEQLTEQNKSEVSQDDRLITIEKLRNPENFNRIESFRINENLRINQNAKIKERLQLSETLKVTQQSKNESVQVKIPVENITIRIPQEPTDLRRKLEQWKLPVLPPAKRPPSRMKPRETKINLPSNSVYHDDDILSIYAPESIMGLEDVDMRTERIDMPKNGKNILEVEDDSKQKYVDNWIASQPCRTAVPPILLSYCFNDCNKSNCRFRHKLSPDFKDQLELLNENDLTFAYNFTTNLPIFEKTFNYFAEQMAKIHPMKVVELIGGVLRNEHYHKTAFIKSIISILQKYGYSMEDAIEEIVLLHGVGNICLNDILITILTEEGDFSNRWTVFQKLISHRYVKLDFGVVVDILNYCCNLQPPNQKLAANIYEFIFKKKLVDLQQIQSYIPIFCRHLNKINLFDYSRELLTEMNELATNGSVSGSSRSSIWNGPSTSRNNVTRNSAPPTNYSPNCTVTKYEQLQRPTNDHYDPCDTDFFPQYASELNSAINRKDVPKFVYLLQICKRNYRLFIANLLTILESRSGIESYDLFINARKALGKFEVDPYLASAVQLWGLNLLPILAKQHLFNQASDIIALFIDNLSDLLKVELLPVFKDKFTDFRKLIFFCQLFTKADRLDEALQLLKSPDFQLLSFRKNSPGPEVAFRDSVVKAFIKRSLEINLNVAFDVILKIITGTSMLNIDIYKHLDELLIQMLDNIHMYSAKIIELIPMIMKKSYKFLNEGVLRGLIVTIFSHSNQDAIQLFKLCIERGIYQDYKGTEAKVILQRNLFPIEIYLIMHILITNMVENNCPYRNIELDIQLPKSRPLQRPKMFARGNLGLQEMQERITNVLQKSFTPPIKGTPTDNNSIMLQPMDYIEYLVKCKQIFDNSKLPK